MARTIVESFIQKFLIGYNNDVAKLLKNDEF